MAMVRCEVAEGLRPSEVVASIIDIRGRTHYIRVERSFISTEGGQAFLPIGIIGIDPNQSAVLIELPHEAETGVHRLWVTAAQFDQPLEALV